MGTLSAALAFLVAAAGVTVAVDPFFHYHGPLKAAAYTLNNQNYQNPGMARHFEYDSVIAGTSMVENFKISYFETVLGAHAIKLPYSGGTSKNINIILNMALKTNPAVQTVYLGLDLDVLQTGDTGATGNPLPAYLYDANPLNDAAYVFNKDVLFGYTLPAVRGAMGGAQAASLDGYSYWHHLYTFSQYAAVHSNRGMQKAETPAVPPDMSGVLALAQRHLENNILPVIKAHPDVKFVVFYPPYSILYWYFKYAEQELAVLRRSVEMLLPYSNVELFFFQNIPEIVANLYHYKDYTHYSAGVNDYMVDCFKNGAHRLTPGNYETELEKMGALARGFNFGLLFGESNPFIGENNFVSYLEKISDARYITFIAACGEAPVSAREIFGAAAARFGLGGGKSGCGYAAAFKGGQIILEEGSDGPVAFSGAVEGLAVDIVCEKRGDAGYIEVLINGVRYTSNQPGMNFVVYDTELGRVMDNMAVNTGDGVIKRQ